MSRPGLTAALVLLGVSLLAFLAGLWAGKARFECPPPDPTVAEAAERAGVEADQWRAEAQRQGARADSLTRVAADAEARVDAARPRYLAARTVARRSVFPTLTTVDDDSLAILASDELRRRRAGGAD